MKRTVLIPVDDLPPKKSGSSSMWGSPRELVRINRLRAAAQERIPLGAVIHGDAVLALRIYVSKNDRLTGDLDTFVAGVCDALMRPPAGVSPRGAITTGGDLGQALGFEDDSQVTEIHAHKIVNPKTRTRYELALTGEWSTGPQRCAVRRPASRESRPIPRLAAAGGGSTTVPPLSKLEKWRRMPKIERFAVRRNEFAEAIAERLAKRQGRWRRFEMTFRMILDDKQVIKVIESTLSDPDFVGSVQREAIHKVCNRIVLLEARMRELQAGLFERDPRRH